MTQPNTLTDADVVRYLRTQPGFFDRESTLLADIRLYNRHSERAVSLSERQIELLRQRLSDLNTQLAAQMELVEQFKANARNNASIAERLNVWIKDVLQTTVDAAIPEALAKGLMAQFSDLQAAIRVWDVSLAFAGEDFAQGVSEDARIFSKSLGTPYCGPANGFEAVSWLDAPERVQSVALIALRSGQLGEVMGLLVLGSADLERFTPDMHTDFLTQIGDLSSAALTRLRV
jgi:uncharacterized protein